MLKQSRDANLLCTLIQRGEISDVHVLHEAGVDVTAADDNGESALHISVGLQSLTITNELLESGADVNARNQNGQMPLHLAASRGYLDLVYMLIQADSDINLKTWYSEMTPLHMAALKGHYDTVKLLLEHGADANSLDMIGKTPSVYAASIKIKELIEHHMERREVQRPLLRAHNRGKIPHQRTSKAYRMEGIKVETTETNMTAKNQTAHWKHDSRAEEKKGIQIKTMKTNMRTMKERYSKKYNKKMK
ncbi:hypothetical protein CHS0354_030178 [Potamilus streckersoni]|uniref:Uncharacterized protein n=1 Tax=Potamilus streckersoni TaxID=2493646 RepID=A0AAE0W0L3_9BIVA|nr:hypothetical protein CHS0354_030178 [Potamilus streckersoni]